MSEKEVGKSSFRGDGQEVSFVLWVDLDAQTNCKKRKRHKCLFFYLYLIAVTCKVVRTVATNITSDVTHTWNNVDIIYIIQ